MTKVLVACPVANREWALPHWFECLAKQTVQPAQALMIHGGSLGDETWQAIADGASSSGIQTIRIHEASPPHDRNLPPDEAGRREPDSARFHTLARLRNQMLAAATIFTDATHVLSLDSDIMIEDPFTIERLLAVIEPLRAETLVDVRVAPMLPDVVAPRVYFHPDAKWTANAGVFGNDRHHPREAVQAGRPQDLGEWPWKRLEGRDQDASVVQIDIPMGAVLMPRRVFSKVRYRWHQGGEDIGFALNLKIANFTAGWLPSVYARHCWDRYHL